MSTIDAKNSVIKNQEHLIVAKDSAIKKLRDNLDTCFVQQKKLEDYTKAISPRNKLYVSGSLIGAKYDLFSGIGAGVGLINKKGVMYEVEGLQYFGQATPQIKLSVKKVISLKRKNK